MDTINHPPLNMALCLKDKDLLETLKLRLQEVGSLPTEPLAVWEEALGMKNYVSDMTMDLQYGDFDVEEFIHKALDVAVCNLRLVQALAQQEMGVSE